MASNPGPPSRRVELPLLQVGRRNHKSCRWGCGDACSKEPPNRSGNETYAAVVERALSRRAFLAAGGVGALVLGAAAAPAEASEYPPVGPYRPNPTGRRLAFTPIAPNNVDDVVLAEGYADRVLIAWGDPVRPGAPGFDFDARPRTGRPASSATTTTTWPSSLSRGGARTASSACCGPTTSTPTRS
jgi:hypothetical protein